MTHHNFKSYRKIMVFRWMPSESPGFDGLIHVQLNFYRLPFVNYVREFFTKIRFFEFT